MVCFDEEQALLFSFLVICRNSDDDDDDYDGNDCNGFDVKDGAVIMIVTAMTMLVMMILVMMIAIVTLPETNIAPENWYFENSSTLGFRLIFRGHVSCWECNIYCLL